MQPELCLSSQIDDQKTRRDSCDYSESTDGPTADKTSTCFTGAQRSLNKSTSEIDS